MLCLLLRCLQVSQFEGCQVLLGVDDLDVFKGIELKLQAFERLLEEHPEWRGKAVLVQVRRGPSAKCYSGSFVLCNYLL
jgi:trehalose-6-phosphate synthase